MSANFASNLSPMPVSTRMFRLPVRTSRQFRPIGTRLRESAGIFFSHSTLGTTPNTWPPSSAKAPSERAQISKSPSFMSSHQRSAVSYQESARQLSACHLESHQQSSN